MICEVDSKINRSSDDHLFDFNLISTSILLASSRKADITFSDMVDACSIRSLHMEERHAGSHTDIPVDMIAA